MAGKARVISTAWMVAYLVYPAINSIIVPHITIVGTCLELTTSGYYGMDLTALIIDCAIARLYRHNGAMNKSVKLEPRTTEWNQTCYKDYTWSMLNCNGEFLG